MARSARGWFRIAGLVVVLVVWLALLLRLGAQERGGPPHIDLSLGDGIPATLYVPGDEDPDEFPVQPREGERPPLVIIAHGYSGDRMIMSPLARSLARAGYAALAFDFRGHGSNTTPFRGELRDDLTDVYDSMEVSPYVDRERIAVLGHSMGAGAVLDFATLDDRPAAVIPVSGGLTANDEATPAHVLFLRAGGDPDRIHDRQRDLAAILDERTDVESVEVDGTDHLSILFSNDAVKEVVGFLDPVFDVDRPGDPPGLDDPRLRTAVLYLVVAVVLITLGGLLVGRFVEPSLSDATAGGLVLVGGALVTTMPLLSNGPVGFLPLGAGQPVVVHLAMSGALLWSARVAARRSVLTGRLATWMGDGSWLPLRDVAWPGIAAGVAMFVLLSPLSVVAHRLVPTPERLLLWVVVAALVLPFFAAFEALVRRGGTWAAVGWGALGRVVLLAVLVAGVGLRLLPGVLGLVIPMLVLQYVLLELFAATCYARGRNPAVIAVVDAVFLGWIVTTLTPIG